MTREISFDEYSEMMEKRNEEDGFFDDDIAEDNDEDADYNDNVENMFLAFVDYIGMESDGKRLYNFFFTNTPDVVWGSDWETIPSSACGKIPPDPSTYNVIKRLHTIIPIMTAQENSCFSMQDCVDNVIAAGWEVLESEYPEDGRLVFQFGEKYQSVENKLAARFQLFVE